MGDWPTASRHARATVLGLRPNTAHTSPSEGARSMRCRAHASMSHQSFPPGPPSSRAVAGRAIAARRASSCDWHRQFRSAEGAERQALSSAAKVCSRPGGAVTSRCSKSGGASVEAAKFTE